MTSKTLNLKQKAGDLDVALCLALNRSLKNPLWYRFMRFVSRMGDGLLWYTLILGLPLLVPDDGLLYAIGITTVGLVNLAVYRRLKAKFARPRPFAFCSDIHQGAPVLDEYSFPSGHTLHSMSFAVMLTAFIPLSGVFLIPFAILTALSRVVLGVHFPSDVAAGVLIGLLHGTVAVALFGALHLI